MSSEEGAFPQRDTSSESEPSTVKLTTAGPSVVEANTDKLTSITPGMSQSSTSQTLAAKGRWRWVRYGALAIIALLLVGGLVSGVNAYLRYQAQLPIVALTTYCSKLTKQDYAGAYAMFSDSARVAMTSDHYLRAQQLHDQIDGVARSCVLAESHAPGHTTVDFRSMSATYTVQLTRKSVFIGDVTLIKAGPVWKVETVAATTEGTDLAPLLVANHFCASLSAADFAAAYTDLSSKQHADASLADFTQKFTQALADSGAKLSGCLPQLASYRVYDAGAMLDMDMQLTVAAPSGPVPVPLGLHFTLVKESTGWKLDQFKSPAS